jgi:hypothetical protein
VSRPLLITVSALGAILLLALDSLAAKDASIFQVFVWLFVLLAVVGAALWPSTGADQRVELELDRLGWADHIAFEEKAAIVSKQDAARSARRLAR